MSDKISLSSGNRKGPTLVYDGLYLCGEDDLDEVLYGKVITESEIYNPPQNNRVDVWIDLRHFSTLNRSLIVPHNVQYVQIPLQDGDLKAAFDVLPLAKAIIDHSISKKRKVAINCHAGSSRSALLALWCLSEKNSDYIESLNQLKKLRPSIAIHENFQPFVQKNIDIYMRNFTFEESDAYEKALDKLFKPTGRNIFD